MARLFGHIQVLEQKEEDLINQTMLRIIDEVGMVIENEEILHRLQDFGGTVDTQAMTVKFAPSFVENFIASSEKANWRDIKPRVSGRTAIAFGYYLDPETDRYELWSIDSILRYLKVAHYLPHTTGNIAYAFSINSVEDNAQLLFFHYLTFKLFGRNLCSLGDITSCPHILEMWETVMEEKGEGAGIPGSAHIHFIPPLKLAREDAKVFLFFAKRGIAIGIGTMLSMCDRCNFAVPCREDLWQHYRAGVLWSETNLPWGHSCANGYVHNVVSI